MQNEPQLSAELPCHLVEKDVYWSLTDADDDYDGYIHLTSVYDGSGMRLSIAGVSGFSQKSPEEAEKNMWELLHKNRKAQLETAIMWAVKGVTA